MLKISDIVGYPIVCNDQKKFRGEVKDAVLDLKNCTLTGLIIDYGSLIHHTRVIPFNSIYKINRNNIMVRFKKNILEIKNMDLNKYFIKKNEKILGCEVIEDNGKLLGFIQDIIFEEKSGNILGLVLTNGMIDDIFNGIQILPINNSIIFEKEKIVILRDTKNDILKNIGGLKKLLELEH
ncbi:PRC-barrel domain-containing protein [Paramaledivibacter caminithermalis]|nr:PRC-barrel domain-containing protein [Paramaledivibacter caminithermalis]